MHAPDSHHDSDLLPSLDPPETTDTSTPVSLSVLSEETAQVLPDTPRHRGWKVRRRLIYEAMVGDGQPSRRAAAFATCGSNVWVLRSRTDPTRFRVAAICCHDRWCIPCARTRARVIAANLTRRLRGKAVRLITLTLARDNRPLTERIDRLLHSWRKLRSLAYMRARLEGTAAFLELTRGASGDHWHPHLHVMASGKFIEQRILAQCWQKITGDSYVVDIRLVHQPKAVAAYVCKYATKPLAMDTIRDPDALYEAMDAMRGRKTVYTTGTWSRWKLLERPTDDTWTFYESLPGIQLRAEHGDPLALAILTELAAQSAHATFTAFQVDPSLLECDEDPP